MLQATIYLFLVPFLGFLAILLLGAWVRSPSKP